MLWLCYLYHCVSVFFTKFLFTSFAKIKIRTYTAFKSNSFYSFLTLITNCIVNNLSVSSFFLTLVRAWSAGSMFHEFPKVATMVRHHMWEWRMWETFFHMALLFFFFRRAWWMMSKHWRMMTEHWWVMSKHWWVMSKHWMRGHHSWKMFTEMSVVKSSSSKVA